MFQYVAALALTGGSSPLSPDDYRTIGRGVYETHCAVCHKSDGRGMPPAFPSLVGAPILQGADARPLARVLVHGRRGTAMQAFGGQLSDMDLAGVATYLRTSWGNKGSVVTAADIKAARAQAVGKK